MKAFIQKHQGEFANISVLTAFLGFREKGYEMFTLEYPELRDLNSHLQLGVRIVQKTDRLIADRSSYCYIAYCC